MRCENIKFTLSIPVLVNSPDDNGTTYTEDAIKNACKKAKNLPLIQFDSYGEKTAIGVVNDIQYSNKTMFVKGIVRYGGTNDIILEFENGMVTSMEIESLGLSN